MKREKRSKKNPRDKKPFAALDISRNPRSRWEYMDQDYIDKLSPEDKDWLNKFQEEWLHACFKKEDNLHTTDEQKREIYNRNNARNRDVLSNSRNIGLIDKGFINQDGKLVQTLYERDPEVNNPAAHEDTLVTLIDTKKEIEKA